MPDLTRFPDGVALQPESPDYDAVRRPVHAAYQDVRPRLIVRCRSVDDVVAGLAYAAASGDSVAVRGGGHCFAGRSSTDGVLLDLARLDGITVTSDGLATIGAGARLAHVYATLHAYGRTLPAGCGPTVGITGLTLGGGLGLLGRKHGLTCDRLVGAQVVLADGTVVDCDQAHEPDLFWALRGAGGGQFGVVTALRFETVPEPATTRVEAHWSGDGIGDVVVAWQTWAPDAPDDLTVNLTVDAQRATLFGAATLDEQTTRELLQEFTKYAGVATTVELLPDLPYHRLKQTFTEPEAGDGNNRPDRMRSEFFARALSDGVLTSLLANLASPLASLGEPGAGGRRRLSFTAMGGAYNRIAENATAFAHRGTRFLLEHIGEATDPWVDRSRAIAHEDGTGRVYPNFPDPALDDWATAYHGSNYARLAAVKKAYDPHRFFDFPQAI
ncbi:FAD-binding oxidoreductase [Hamadaea sp.]|uniref:FAD-binding oxidoreductase n=1 Tax=Hamadaea sp. TaxID=2024425 RepID=UPI0025C26425|nr:FAD-binding oxidoreductase [Hamadaea sp.]